ncbi:BON domain-containing protein [Actinophytocola xanthii]|nr:BON domain-containing protein [Actinophytocola xanthii]
MSTAVMGLDEEIRERVERAVAAAAPAEHAVVTASVDRGVVLLVGRVEYHATLPAVERAVRAVPGVVEVRNRIGYLWGDGSGRGA